MVMLKPAAYRFHASALALAAVLGSAAPAMAQDSADAAASDNSDEIVVTAQFRSQRLQDVPIAITAVTGEMMEQRGQTNLADIGNNAPNVTLRQSAASFGPAVSAYIRGVGQRDTNFALEPGVGLYIDDVYLPTMHGSLLNLVDLDRVEILRGPQGTLAGQNSIGGAIKLYSRKPDGSGEGYLSATYGSFNRLEVRGAADFTLVDDRLFARVTGAGVSRDGYVTRYDYRCTHPTSTVPSTVTGNDCKLGTEGGKEYLAGRLALRWLASDDITVDVAGDVTRDGSEVAPSTLLYVGRAAAPGQMLTGVATPAAAAYVLNGNIYGGPTGSPFVSYSPFGNFAQDTFSNSPYINYENYTDTAPRDGSAAWQAPLKSALNTWGISATVQADLTPDLRLTSISAYREFDGIYGTGDGSPFNPSLQANQVFNWQVSQEVRLSAALGDLANLTVGGFYFKKKSRYDARITLTTLYFLEEDIIPATNTAAFANLEIYPVEDLTVLAGIRYSDQKKSFEYGRFGVPGSNTGGAVPPALAPLNGLVGTFSGDRVDYRLGAQYRFSDEIMAYAQWSTGFRGGGINPRPFFPQQALPHDPETLEAYEIGFKTDLFDRTLRFNNSAFINKYQDILVNVSNCPLTGAPAAPCALPLNAGNATIKGFESELSWNPIEGLQFDASLAYLTFKYTSISAAAANSGIGLEDRGQYISPWQYSFSASYEADLGSSGTLTPRIDVSHIDSFNRNSNNVDAATGGEDIFGQVPGYTLVNTRVTYATEDRDWELALEVRNLTDKLYWTDFFDNRGSTNGVQATPAEPRTWAVSVKRRF
ncbi:TonB-dependent receptor [Altererythrobacter buctensis]|uniref:TonB-dependent receptor n=2 Tax=Alteraurantiacibacter buctensis TaxID=1503981 RepID=A0A844YR72_9SPHN|nr:TonB-dependent receptor [Alteraurantiacibacter buctensis]